MLYSIGAYRYRSLLAHSKNHRHAIVSENQLGQQWGSMCACMCTKDQDTACSAQICVFPKKLTVTSTANTASNSANGMTIQSNPS